MRTYQTLDLTIDAGIATLTLSRPDRLNAFSMQMHAELRAALDEIELAIGAPQPLRALIVTGAGRAFCAGQDLSERRRADGEPAPDLGASLRGNYNPLILRLARLPIPVVAAVNGAAVGSGANLALACDLVVAGRSASFVQPFSRIGLIPDGGGTWTLPRVAGMARAKGLAFLGDKLSAQQAADWGLIWQVVDDAELAATASALAQRLARLPTQSFALQKRAFAASTTSTLAEQLELEAELQAEAARSADYREGVAAFFDKREPVFAGR